MQTDDFEVKSFPSLPRFELENSSKRGLRVCIATEEIFGPVRNGGIASTYYHLARVLSDSGHSVTVLYLKGQVCENQTIEHWIEFYGCLDVRFVPLPAGSFDLICSSPRWQRQMYQLHAWLKDEEPYDVVHTSEWRGGAYYALLAKRLGLAFERTLFLVKTSSPWIWNRHYRMLPLGTKSELARMYPERRVVELADVVIGGSAHLLTFMEEKGYSLPAGRTFVQPNIIDLQDLEVREGRPHYQYGDTVKSGELVFFGRLEARKGLDIFCEAISRIVAQGIHPEKVTFLGKQGERLPAYPDISTVDFIQRQSRAWPFPIEIISTYDQDRAIGYLCASPRVAVMPSVIENSTMTVYECLVHRIPFLASKVGGTPELVSADYREQVLVEPHPEALSHALQVVLREGATVAEGAFDYRDNLAVWRKFHDYLSVTLGSKSVNEVLSDIVEHGGCGQEPERLRPESGESVTGAQARETARWDPSARVSTSLCIYYHQHRDLLNLLLDSLISKDQEVDEVIIVDDGSQPEEVLQLSEHIQEHFVSRHLRVIRQPHRCIGSALNAAAGEASGDLLVFMNAEYHYCEPDFMNVLRRAAAKSPAAAFTCFHAFFEGQEPDHHDDDIRVAPLGGDLATGFYDDNVFGGSCFAVRRTVFHALKGFYEGFHLAGIEQEFQTRLVVAGHELDVIPEVLYWERRIAPATPFNKRSKEYLAIRPHIQNAPGYLENIMLTARMLGRKLERAEANSHAQRAKLAMQNRDWDTACKVWADMRLAFPYEAAGFVRGAAALKRAGRLEEADSVARNAVKRFPDHAGGYMQRAEIAMQRRDWERASKLWAEMRRAFPYEATGFVRGAAALKRAGRLEEAEKVADSAVKRFPGHAGGYIQRAEVAMQRRDWDAAGRLWAEMRRTFVNNATGFVRGAAALMRAGRVEEAREVRRLADRLQGRSAAEVATSGHEPSQPGLPQPYPGTHTMALGRRRSRFGIESLEVGLLLDPGWLARARDGSEAACELRRNGRVVARAPLEQASGNALRMATGWRIPSIGDILWSIHDASNGEVLSALITPARRSAHRLTGGVEKGPGPEVRGWVLDPSDPGRSRRVAIHVDGHLFDVVAAEERRADVAQCQATGGCHGFVWRIPKTLEVDENTHVDVFDADTGRPLHGSPVQLGDGQMVVSEERST